MTRCTVGGCTRPPYARDLCEPHYRRTRRTGSASPAHPIGEAPSPAVCSVDGCDRTAVERGWCHAHYLRWTRLGDVEADQPVSRRRQPARCTAVGCDRPSHSGGLCRAHHKRLLRGGAGDLDVPIPGSGPRGAGSIHRLGYRYVPVPADDLWLTGGARRVFEQRLVMARYLRRPLTDEENVHHRNGDRLDNRIENLELWSTSQPSGQRVEDKVHHAREVLRRYAPHFLVTECSPDQI